MARVLVIGDDSTRELLSEMFGPPVDMVQPGEPHDFKLFARIESVKDFSKAPAPAYSPYMVQCLIERDGPTEMVLEGVRYLFARNECGHYVCNVQRNDHRKYLCSLGTFKIYQAEKLPVPFFTDDEQAFIDAWKSMDKESFRAYINGHFERFHAERIRVRKVAIEKWTVLHHRDKIPQPCPINLDELPEKTDSVDEDTLEPRPLSDGQPPIIPPDESESWTDDQWSAWQNTWVRFNAERFEKFVSENEDRFLNSNEDTWDKAKAKWEKLLPDTPWPIAGEDE
jgi:hypothetical protein